MAKIVKGPKPKRVKCQECKATIEYLPEEVKTRSYTCMGEPSGDTYVKCPRPGCPGDGIIESW